MRTLRLLLFALLALGWNVAAHADIVQMTLAPSAGVAGTGGKGAFQATLQNTMGTDVLLNQVSVSFSDTLLLNADPTAFYSNFNGTLAAHSASPATGSAGLFTVQVDPSTPAGIYHGVVTILGDGSGGGDPNASDNLAQVDFTVQVFADTTPPTVTILSGPAEGDLIGVNNVLFTYTGTDDYTLTSDLQYAYTFDGGAPSIVSANTSAAFNGLVDGPHKFILWAVDAANNPQTPPGPNAVTRHFTIDTLLPTVSGVSAPQILDAAVGIIWTSNKATTSRVEYKPSVDSSFQTTPEDTTFVTGHQVAIYGLIPSTQYTYHVISKDRLGRVATSADLTFTTLADTTPPQTAITSPADQAHIRPGTLVFNWAGVDDVTPTSDLKYQYLLDATNFPTPTDANTTTATTVSQAFAVNGTHTFKVRAIDAAGNTDPNPSVITFYIDGTGPAVTGPTVSNVTFNSAQINWSTQVSPDAGAAGKLTTGIVQYALDDGSDYTTTLQFVDGGLSATHSLVIGPLGSNTKYKVRVTAIDQAGNQTMSGEAKFTSGPLHDLAVASSDLSVSNKAPASGDSITLSAHIHNPGDVAETGTVVFYDASAQGTREVGRKNVSILAYADVDTVVTSPPFVVLEGVHNPYVQIINGTPNEDIFSNNFATINLLVGAPPCRFSLGVSNPQTYPGNTSLFTVIVKNTGSQSQSIANLTLAGPSWVTLAQALPAGNLAPGDEAQVTYQIAAPLSLTPGTLARPGLVPLTLSVPCGQNLISTNFNIEVYSGPTGTVDLTVVDDSTGAPIQGATIALDGTDKTYFTGPNGKSVDHFGNPAPITVLGAGQIYAVSNNYLPNQIANDTTHPVVLRLKPGKPLEVTEVKLTPLTPKQIQDRGVNLADPANYFVADFVVSIKIGPLPIRNIVLPYHPVAGSSFSGVVYGGGGGGGGGGGFGGGGGYTTFYSVYYPTPDPTIHTDTFIIIPGDIRILKQFWDATVIIKNNSNFPITDVVGSLVLPNGLSFPDLFNLPQPSSKSIGTIDANTQKQASWVIRGDRPGIYTVTGTATGNIQLGGGAVALSDSLTSSPITVAEPKINVSFQTLNPGQVIHVGDQFPLKINVTNQSTIDLNLVTITIKADKLVNCHLAPSQNSAQLIPVIPIGQTKSVTFQFISDVTGVVEEVTSYVSPFDVQPPVNVKPAPVLPPVANNDTAITTTGTPVTINVLSNDLDVQGYPLTVTQVTNATNGTVVKNGDQTITYTPNSGFAGVDTFFYTINDGVLNNNSSARVDVTVGNPVPNITSLSPTNKPADGAAFALTVNGSGFINGSVVSWNGAAQTTTFHPAVGVTPAYLTAAVPGSLVASAGAANITVINPAPGGGTSNTKVFLFGSPNISYKVTTRDTSVAGFDTVTYQATNTGNADALNFTLLGGNFLANQGVTYSSNTSPGGTTIAPGSNVTFTVKWKLPAAGLTGNFATKFKATWNRLAGPVHTDNPTLLVTYP